MKITLKPENYELIQCRYQLQLIQCRYHYTAFNVL